MRNVLLLLTLLLPTALHAQAPPVLLTSPNPAPAGEFGSSVSGVPDADGDGWGDLLIGAYDENAGAEGTGRAYLYSGATGELLRTLVSPNTEISGGFGVSVAGVPDADGDGRGDLLVGASREDGGADAAGRAYLFSGATGTLLRTLSTPNPQPFGFFGGAVSGVPDVNGDGRGDLLIGASGEDGGATQSGRAYLFSGATGARLRTLISSSPKAGGGFGSSVSGVPDTNGDDRGDLLVGAFREDGVAVDDGQAYLFSGATGVRLRTLTSPNPVFDGRFGWSVSGVPDASGDGRGDLLVGAHFENGGAVQAGRAYLFNGSTGERLRAFTSPNFEALAFFGSSVSGIPDADGDGRGDLLVGAYREDGGADDAGRAHVFSGATGALLRTLTSPHLEFRGEFGVAVSGVPDADGDGRGDLLAGAHEEDGGALDAGRAYFFPSGTGGGLTVSASGSPTTIPPGGTITVKAIVSNNTSQPAALDLWVVVERSGNDVLTRLIGSGVLPAGATVTRSFGLTAPYTTPSGEYTLNVNVGAFPNTVLATDAFDVTVTAGLGRRSGALAWSVVGAEPWEAALAQMGSVPTESSVVVCPNPFSGQTVLSYGLPTATYVRLAVHDALGREVAVLVDEAREAGEHAVAFDASALPAGIYLVRLTAEGGFTHTQRVTLLR